MRILFVFLDGVGLGEDDAARNVFVANPTPTLTALLDGAVPLAATTPIVSARATLRGLDARFGIDGLPQSGTGQAALFTGRDAAAMFGRHFGPWVPASLRPLVRERSLLARARRAGLDVAFANAYPEEILADAGEAANGSEALEERAADVGIEGQGASDARVPTDAGRGRARRASRFLSAGPPLAALGAGVLVRHTDALQQGAALASEITNDSWKTRLGRTGLPDLTAREAGINLARIAAAHDLTLFAHYGTDYAGHARSMPAAIAAMNRVDAFFGGVLESMPDDMLLVVSSDHGNIEDVAAGHTINPAIGLVAGEGHERLSADWRSLLDVAPSILRALGVE